MYVGEKMVEKIELSDGQKIELANPKGRHTKKGLKLLAKISSDENELEAMNQYLDYIDEVSSELTGLSVDDLDELDDDDKNKITKYYQEKIAGKFDFFNSLLKQESS